MSFDHFWRLGYRRLIPIIPPDAEISARSTLAKRVGTKQDGRGKTPGVQGRDGKWSSFNWGEHEADEADLARWEQMGAGVGIKTGQVIAIDADTLDIGHARNIQGVVEKRFGLLPARIGRNPKCLYVLRAEGTVPYMRVEFGDERVELLTEGKQFVAEGIHPTTGKPYTWPRELVPFDDLPIATEAELRAFFDELRAILPESSKVITEGAGKEVSQAALTGPVEAVRAAVSATPNSSNMFPSRESYRDFGYAIKAALPDNEAEALEIFEDWCARWDGGENDPDVVRADWARMKPPFRRGASWLYELAETYGDFDRSSVWFTPIEDSAPNPFEIAEARQQAEGKNTRRLELISLQAAAASALEASNRPLVKGFLDQGTLSVMYGPSNVGKTFVAMDVFFHIATGLPWGGMKTSEGKVVYVAAEGGAGARKRADALVRRYGAAVGEARLNAFYLHLASIDLLRPDADIEPLIATLLDVGPIVAVGLDTLSRVMAGGEENSSVDMGVLVRHVDRIRHATGAHVMLVHHSGKDAARGARGHSLLRAATDTEIEIGDGQIAVTKQRDLDKGFSSAFRLDVCELGVDADGERITSCTVGLTPRLEGPSVPLTPKEETVLEAINVLLSTADDSARGARTADIADYLKEAGADDMSVETVRTHLRNMSKKHAVRSPARGFWAVCMSIVSPTVVLRPVADDDRNTEESGRKAVESVFQ